MHKIKLSEQYPVFAECMHKEIYTNNNNLVQKIIDLQCLKPLSDYF